MDTLPAIVIGGPPHSGKSVLTYSLSMALRERDVPHYVLRTAPDGEGDWFNQIAADVARTLRYKLSFTPEFVDRVCAFLRDRHLPLLVDVGGKPTRDQERVFDFCTYAILLTRDAESHAAWVNLMERHSVPVIADLHSQLEGVSEVWATSPVLRGVITGLERGSRAQGPVFDLLVERVAAIFAYEEDELRALHHHIAPKAHLVDMDLLPRQWHPSDARWRPDDIPRGLALVPSGHALALYGRAPNWAYAAFAVHAWPAPCYQFDARYGWVASPTLQAGEPTLSVDLEWNVRGPVTWLHVRLRRPLLDYHRVHLLPLRPLTTPGLVLDGKLPHWLTTALARAYVSQAQWIAVYQPQLDPGRQGAVVVASKQSALPVGSVWRGP